MLMRIYESLRCRAWNRIGQRYFKRQMHACGSDVTIGQGFHACGIENVTVGSHIYIGDGARFLSAIAPISIGDYCMFGPEVMIITGNHRFDVIGEYMYQVKEKLPENDQAVCIEDDVWIGARAIILKGSKIGTGSIIAVGAIVTGEIPPYSIYLGNGKIRSRFTDEEVKAHREAMIKHGHSHP